MASLLYLAFYPINYLSEKLRVLTSAKLAKFTEQLNNELKKIPPEKAVEPNPQIAGNALSAIQFCLDEDEICSMFASLIASSVNSDFADKIHPCFSEIIKQMTGADAIDFRLFSHHSAIPIFRLESECGEHIDRLSSRFMVHRELYNENVQAISLSALKHLGVVEEIYGENLHTENGQIFTTDDSSFIINNAWKEFDLYYEQKGEKGVAIPTPLGKALLKVCCPD